MIDCTTWSSIHGLINEDFNQTSQDSSRFCKNIVFKVFDWDMSILMGNSLLLLCNRGAHPSNLQPSIDLEIEIEDSGHVISSLCNVNHEGSFHRRSFK